jgi:hypothetical protein
MWEVIVRFLDNGEIVEHHCLNCLFIKYSILLLQIEQSLDKMGYPDFMMNDQQLASIYQTVSSCRNHIWIEI